MYEYEVVRAATKLLGDMFKVQKGETVVITSDTESSKEVVDATAQAAYALGAKPMVINVAAPRGVGKAGDIDLPMGPLTAALKEADIWIEYNNQWLLYSTPFDEAFKHNKNLRYMCLVGMNPDLMVRNIGRVNNVKLGEFLKKAEDITKAAKHVRITTKAGCDIEFENHPTRDFYTADGFVGPGEIKMMAGQISWAPVFETINGTIVFDGSAVPPCGKLNDNIKLSIEKGKVVKVEGGADAKAFEAYLKSFDDERMFQVAHLSYGFNPGAKCTGDIVEDERVWGSTEWGIGNIGPMLTSDIPGGIPAPSHTDGICLDSSVWLDGKLFIEEGVVVGPTEDVVDLANEAINLEY